MTLVPGRPSFGETPLTSGHSLISSPFPLASLVLDLVILQGSRCMEVGTRYGRGNGARLAGKIMATKKQTQKQQKIDASSRSSQKLSKFFKLDTSRKRY